MRASGQKGWQRLGSSAKGKISSRAGVSWVTLSPPLHPSSSHFPFTLATVIPRDTEAQLDAYLAALSTPSKSFTRRRALWPAPQLESSRQSGAEIEGLPYPMLCIHIHRPANPPPGNQKRRPST